MLFQYDCDITPERARQLEKCYTRCVTRLGPLSKLSSGVGENRVVWLFTEEIVDGDTVVTIDRE